MVMGRHIFKAISALLLFAMSIAGSFPSPAHAEGTPNFDSSAAQFNKLIGKSTECTKIYYEARAKYGKMTPGEMVAAGILTGAIGLGISDAIRADAGERAAHRAELECLTARGLITKQQAGDPATTPRGALSTCHNQATTCYGALSSCLAGCNSGHHGSGCQKSCNAAVQFCRSSGTWRTANCIKTGMVK